MTDTVKVIRKLGRGARPTSLRLSTTHEGYVDARNFNLPTSAPTERIATPAGNLEIDRDFAVFRGLRLRKIDLSGSRIAHSLWLNCRLEDVKLDRADARLVAFSGGRLDKVSFRQTDLSGSAWGMTGRSGPVVSDCVFVESNMAQSAYGHLLFRNCVFDTLLERLMYEGARFEDCTFAGTLKYIWFDQTTGDPRPSEASKLTSMSNVDFSRARMVAVSFKGVDLSSVTLPATGHVVINRPRAVFENALRRVSAEWVGDNRDEAKAFLETQLAYQVRIPDTTFVFHPHDFLEMSLSPQVAERLIQELESAAKELHSGG